METIRFPQPYHRENSICFTGPRPAALPVKKELEQMKYRLTSAIVEAICSGKDTFIFGCQAGFDILAAEHVIALQSVHPHIRCFFIAPFSIGFLQYNWWTPEWIARANRVLQAGSFRISLYEKYVGGAYYEHSRLLVDSSVSVIAYCPVQKGGTWYTVSYAKRQGLAVQNIAGNVR